MNNSNYKRYSTNTAQIPLYINIKNILQQRITLEQQWKTGEKIPPERELVKELNISRNTLRKALDILISEGYLFSEVGRGTFVNSRQYWGHASIIGKSKLIGLFITDINFDFGKKIVRGVEDYLHKRGYSLILCQDHYSLEKTYNYINSLIRTAVAGVILNPILTDNFIIDNLQLLQIFKEEEIPVVLIDREIPESNLISIKTNNEEISFNATEYLLNNNHQQILIIRRDSEIAAQRAQGAKNAYKKRGLDPINCHEIVLKITYKRNKDLHTIISILQNNPHVTAVFAMDEYIGKLFYHATIKLGKKIPEDISFITFDHPEESSFDEGKISYIEQPLTRMGNMAAKAIIDSIEAKLIQNKQQIIKSKLIYGRSIRLL